MSARETRYQRGSRLLLEDWKSTFYRTLRDRPYPLLVFERNAVPAASLWTGARLWVRAFRAAGLRPGDRLLLALPPSPEFLYVLIAAFCEGLCLAPFVVHADETARPDFFADVLRTLGDEIDARTAIVPGPGDPETQYLWAVDTGGLPPARHEHAGESFILPRLRESRQAPAPELRLLLRTSGSTAQPRWIALTDTNLFSVLTSHQHIFARGTPDAPAVPRVLSVLPWAHAFGLMIDLLPALLNGAEIVRDPEAGRSTESVMQHMREHGITHLSAVPLILRRLFAHDGGPELVRALHGGVVGGAPVSARLAAQLRGTRLRAGYGQTEAGPGITLGEPGEWQTGFLGRAAGCEVRINAEQELEFRGPNRCAGVWRGAGGLTPLPAADGFVRTGDLVRRIQSAGTSDDAFVFSGRIDDSFKLENGRFVRAGMFEARLKECFPDVWDEVLVYSPDGASIALCYVAVTEDAAPPSADALHAAAGLRVDRFVALDARDIVRNGKGDIDRRRTLERLTD